MLTALNNVMSRCGQGRAAAVTGIYFGNFDTTVSSFRAMIDGNNIDAATPVHKASHDIPIVSTRYPTTQLIQQHQDALNANANAITANTTSIASNDVEIASLMTTTTANATAISGNAVGIQTNASDIGTKQDTLVWATVADDHDTRPVTSKNIKAYVDSNSGGGGFSGTSNRIMVTDGNGAASASSITTSTLDQFVPFANNKLDLESSNGPSVKMLRTGWDFPMSIASHGLYGSVGMSNTTLIYAPEGNGALGRLQCSATHIKLPQGSTTPPQPTIHCKGGLWVDTTTSPFKLMFHDNTGWQQIS